MSVKYKTCRRRLNAHRLRRRQMHRHRRAGRDRRNNWLYQKLHSDPAALRRKVLELILNCNLFAQVGYRMGFGL